MKRTFVIICLFFIASTTIANNSTNNNTITNSSINANIDGSWRTTVVTPEGDVKMSFTFRVEGEKLTGSSNGPFGSFPISNGNINGNEFSFDVAFQGMIIGHQCTIDGDVITMKVTGLPSEGDALILNRIQP